MLLLLKKADGSVIYLKPDNAYNVGRKNSEILLDNDKSISRNHAKITVYEKHATLEDCGSKYKTRKNNTVLEPHQPVTLNEGDEIKFGEYQNIYRICVLEIATVGSKLTVQQKNKLSKIIEAMGGKIRENWDETCTHLTIQKAVLTPKVLHALLDAKPIVNLDFWIQFCKNMIANLPPPKPDDYLPQVNEALLSAASFAPDIRRKSLFANKTFVFPNEKSVSDLNSIVTKAGGKIVIWKPNLFKQSQIEHLKNEYIFVRNDEELDPTLSTVFDMIKSRGQRIVARPEIAMAIALGSCEEKCNPNFNLIERIFKNGTQTHDDIKPRTLALETEAFSLDAVKTERIIQETEVIDPDVPSTSHTPIANPFKTFQKQKINENKRKITESIDDTDRNQSEIAIEQPSIKKLKSNPFAQYQNKKTIANQTPPPFDGDEEENNNQMIIESVIDKENVTANLSRQNQTSTNDTVPDRDPEITNSRWISKKTIENATESTVINPDDQDYVKLFKHGMIIEESTKTLTRKDNTVVASSAPVINFKKFKHVQSAGFLNRTILMAPAQHGGEPRVIGEERNEPPAKKKKTFNFI